MNSVWACLVCGKAFTRPGDRERHIKAVKDIAHRQYYLRQTESHMARISETVNRVMVSHQAVSRQAGPAQRAQALQPALFHDAVPNAMDLDHDENKKYEDVEGEDYNFELEAYGLDDGHQACRSILSTEVV
ncbi:hypothetical protein BDP27DRAFT_1366988 [Rhodocollybia butyracea]|uniref:C2H2-type domain-containing protein n=1 Tax=Rhodocollybia butyracea TaxID=206335 RepID=A0A9P5U397_9AGAR|nr:hypothetical protein BDP27DRAFT_1366988 [Rhodocollybia butyracea]